MGMDYKLILQPPAVYTPLSVHVDFYFVSIFRLCPRSSTLSFSPVHEWLAEKQFGVQTFPQVLQVKTSSS